MKKKYKYYCVWYTFLIILFLLFVPIIITSFELKSGDLNDYLGTILFRKSELGWHSKFYIVYLENGDSLITTSTKTPRNIDEILQNIEDDKSEVKIQYTRTFWPFSFNHHILISLKTNEKVIVDGSDSLSYWGGLGILGIVLLSVLTFLTALLHIISCIYKGRRFKKYKKKRNK